MTLGDEILRWYLVLGAVQAAFWPLLFRHLNCLADRGYSISRSAGLLAVGWLCWSGWAYQQWTFHWSAAWACCLVLAAAIWGREIWFGRGSRPLQWLREQWRLVLAVEVVHAAAFAVIVLLRAGIPFTGHTEQPGDLMFLNSVFAAARFPPEDAWLAGFPVSYYSFGYFLQALLCKLSGTSPDIGYNLGLATLFAGLCTGCFGTVFNLVAGTRADTHRELSSSRPGGSRPIAAGLMSVGLICLSGNLRSWWDLSHYFSRQPNWWWNPSRAITDLGLDHRGFSMITEFPAFSYILGDNHPHLQSAPYLLVAMLLGLNLCRRWGGGCASAGTLVSGAGKDPVITGADRLGFGLVTGCLIATSTWDLVAAMLCWCVVLFAVIGRQLEPSALTPHRIRTMLGAIREFGLVIGCAAILFAPHFLTADARVFGLLPNLFHPTRLVEFLSTAGPVWLGVVILGARFLPGVHRTARVWLIPAWFVLMALFLGAGLGWASGSTRAVSWLSGLGWDGQSSLWTVVALRWARSPWVMIGLSAGIYGAWLAASHLRRSRYSAEAYSVAMAGIGLVLLAIPELIFVHDVFGSRTNTVFKFYYSAWLLVGVAGAYAFGTGSRRVRILGWGLLLAGLAYPTAAAWSRWDRPEWGLARLDVGREVRRQWSDLAAATEWITRHLPPDIPILEAAGTGGTPMFPSLSVLTGRATIIGLAGHELQWRSGEGPVHLIGNRVREVTEVYTAADGETLQAALQRLDINWVLVGPRELMQFSGAKGLTVLDQACPKVVSFGEVRLYRCAQECPEDGDGKR